MRHICECLKMVVLCKQKTQFQCALAFRVAFLLLVDGLVSAKNIPVQALQILPNLPHNR